MPFRDPDDLLTVGPVARLPEQLPAEDDEPAFAETVSAAFRQGNTIGSWWTHRLGIDGEVDPEYDPFAEIAGTPYADYADAFALVDTPAESQRVKARIDQELQDRQTLYAAGGMGVAASMAAGLLDPINLVPLGGAAAAGGTVLKAGVRTAMAGFLGMSAYESALHTTQMTRTYGESAANIAAGTLLAGILGAGAGALGKRMRTRMEGMIEADLDLKAMAHASAMDPDKVAVTEDELLGIPAYHGTAGEFTEFDPNKIGSGQGAAAYGHGFYFAENPAVAGEILNDIGGGKVKRVRLDVSDDTVLNWDTNLDSQTPAVRASVVKFVAGRLGSVEAAEAWITGRTGAALPGPRPTTADLLLLGGDGKTANRLSFLFGTDEYSSAVKRASSDLHAAGIHGIKYLDAVSREQELTGVGSSPTTRNFVIFPEAASRIVIEPDLSGVKAQAAPQPRSPAEGEVLPPPGGPVYEKLSKAFGVEKLSAMLHLSPALRIMVSSQSAEARKALLQLIELPMELEKNTSGIGTAASVEARIKMYRSVEADLVRETDAQYRAYRRRVSGKQPLPEGRRDYRNRMANVAAQASDYLPGATRRLSKKEFKQKVGLAATQGDIRRTGAAAPEIETLAKFYRKNLFEPMQKQLESQGLLPEGVKTDTAISYLTRVYKNEVLRQDPDDAFQKLAASWAMSRHPEMSHSDAMRAGAEIRQSLLGTPGGRVPYESMEVGAASPLKQRVFTVADSELHQIGVLDTDIETVGRMYLRTMSSDIELQRAFGTVRFDGSEPFKAIVAEYDQLAQAAKGPARSALHKERDEVLRKISAMWDLLRGTSPAGRSIPPDALSKRIGAGVRMVTALGMGGRFAVNSLTDFGRVTMGHGFARVLKAPVQALQTGLAGVQLTVRELEKAGVALDTLLDTRMSSMADIGDELRPTTKLERGLHAASSNFFLLNGLSPLTTLQKQFGGLIVHQRILEVVDKIAEGGGGARDVRDMAALGIGRAEARKIAAQRANWDTSRKLWTSHTDRWSDGDAVQAFRIALQRSVDRMVTTPGVGDRPIPLVSNDMGKLIGQFRGFNFAVVNSGLITLMQKARHGDAAALSGLSAQVFLGMLVYWVNAQQHDKPIATDARTLIAEGIDRSGALGFYADINNMAEVMSRGTIGINALAGGPVLSRYAGRNYIGAVLGPQVSRMEDIAKLTGALSTGEVTEADTRAMRRMLPYQNVWYLERLFDLVEESTNEALGVPMKRKRLQ